jgi:hypothetical protein
LNRANGDLTAAREWSPAERRQRRRTAKKLNLARHLELARALRWGSKGWTAEQDALLGTARDATLAKRFSRTETAVRVRRVRLGIPTALACRPAFV